MKSIMISIKPKWVEKIIKKEKTQEIRKNYPKIKTPFKCYIYMSKEKNKSKNKWINENQQKVIGEFICNKIEQIPLVSNFPWSHPFYLYSDKTCVNNKEIEKYGKFKKLYSFNITNVKIYDKAIELYEFLNYNKYEKCLEKNCFSSNCFICQNNAIVTTPPQNWCYVEEKDLL